MLVLYLYETSFHYSSLCFNVINDSFCIAYYLFQAEVMEEANVDDRRKAKEAREIAAREAGI